MTLLQIFLLVNAVLLGVVITLAVQYGLAHRRGQKTAAKTTAQNTPVPAAVRERIAKQAEANFQGIVNRSSLQLQHDLGATSTQLNKLLEKFGTEVLDDEMRLFRANVSDIREATQGSLAGAQEQIAAQQTAILKSLTDRQADMEAKLSSKQAELEAQLEQSIQSQRDALSTKMNEKLNDAVMAFLLETLGHEVDLGAQADYLLATLEANKAELIGGTTGARPGAKS